MKRTELKRRTPLKARKPLRAKQELRRGAPLAPVSAQRRRDNTQRTKVVNGLRLLQRGICPRCRSYDAPLHGHERRGRAQGASILAPECALCPACNGWCEDYPQKAAFTGWKVSAKWPHDQALRVGEAWDLAGRRVVFADLAPDELEQIA